MRTARKWAAGALAAAVIAGGGWAAEAAESAEDNPYQRGPDPTAASLEADAGPFAVQSQDAPGNGSFNRGTVFYPTDTSSGTFGALAVSPGFMSVEAAIKWLGPRLASHGFVVITLDTKSPTDDPPARGDQLLGALDWLVSDASPVADRVDPSRLGVLGHSMGGGGALEAAAKRPGLKATVPLTPWDITKDWSAESVPSLVVGAENDSIAGVAQHAEPFYESLGGKKAYLEMRGEDHFVPNSPTPTIGKYAVAWLKRWVDSDVRYDQFLCPAPAADSVISEFRETCPL